MSDEAVPTRPTYVIVGGSMHGQVREVSANAGRVVKQTIDGEEVYHRVSVRVSGSRYLTMFVLGQPSDPDPWLVVDALVLAFGLAQGVVTGVDR